MFDQLVRFLTGADDALQSGHRNDAAFALAVLLIEVGRSDDRVEAREQSLIALALARRFGLDRSEVASLVAAAKEGAIKATDLHHFTQVVVGSFNEEERIGVIEMLWDVAYSDSVLTGDEDAIIVDVEATTAIRQAEVTAAKRMIERSLEGFALDPARLIGDTAYGSAEMLNWLVHDRGIEPHTPVFDKSQRPDGTFSREDFAYDHVSDIYRCPAGKALQRYRRRFTVPRSGVMKNNMIYYRASKHDCGPCPLKSGCCPNEPARKVQRSIHEGARDLAREIAKTEAYRTSRCQRKKVEMLFAHLKRILKLDRLRLRGPNGARDEFHLAATAQNLRKLAMLIPMPTPTSAT